MGCIAPQALLSGLVARIRQESYRVTDADLRAILGAGVSRAEIEAALSRGELETAKEPWIHARAVLASL